MSVDAYRGNREAWDRLARDKDRLARPARDEDFEDPLKTIDGAGWLEGSISGKRVLCLAAGGGRHGPIYAAAGARVTVVDNSPAMLRLDREVATERGLALATIEASMDDLSALSVMEFDVVIHPVSTCYVPDVAKVYKEVARVLRPGGLYISQHKQPASLQTTIEAVDGSYKILHPYYGNGPLPLEAGQNLVRERGAIEYIHGFQQLLGSMCRAGMVIEDIVEPVHAKRDAAPGSFAHRSHYVVPYIRVKARRVGNRSFLKKA